MTDMREPDDLLVSACHSAIHTKIYMLHEPDDLCLPATVPHLR
jgi:hypothetical protein